MNILFVCLGNICRSVMAMMMFDDMVKDNMIDNIYVDSCGTSDEEKGNSIYPLAKEELIKHGIKITEHYARKIEKSDYEKFDLIICMDYNNLNYLKHLFNDTDKKIHLLYDFANMEKEIDDPWYTRNFKLCYEEIVFCLKYLLEYVRLNYDIR